MAGILYNDHRRPIERDVAQLGSAFVLGTKCHGFQSCHSYLLLLLWAVTRDPLRSIQIEDIKNLSFYETICMQDVVGVQKESFSLQSLSTVIIKRS